MANSILNNTSGNTSGNVLSQIMQFGNSFQGDPKQAVMQLMQQRGYSNAQLQQVMNTARQLQSILPK